MTLGGACAQEADDRAGPDVATDAVDFEATAAFLSAASQRSSGEAYRVEAWMTMRVLGGGEDIDIDADVPFLEGEQDGTSFAFHMDMGAWLEEVSATAGSSGAIAGLGEMSADMAGDEAALYIRGPLFATVAELGAFDEDLGPLDTLAALDDQWGRVDLAALGESSLGELQLSAGGAAGGDPRVLLDLVSSAENVEDLGTDEIGGTAVHGASAELSLGEMLEAQGTAPEAFSEQMQSGVAGGSAAGGDEVGQVTEAVLDAELPLEVWVDDDGYVRRIAYEMDFRRLLGADELGLMEIDELSMGSRMDFSDYGDPSIQVELPADAVDVTDAYEALLAGG